MHKKGAICSSVTNTGDSIPAVQMHENETDWFKEGGRKSFSFYLAILHTHTHKKKQFLFLVFVKDPLLCCISISGGKVFFSSNSLQYSCTPRVYFLTISSTVQHEISKNNTKYDNQVTHEIPEK